MPRFNDTVKQAEKKYDIGKSSSLILEEGTNRIRILTLGYPVASHFMGKGKKSLTCIGKDDGCPHHEADNDKPRLQFVMLVVDREANGEKRDGKVKPFFAPYTVMKQLAALQENPDWSFDDLPMNYDVVVSVKNAKTKEVEYTLTPSPKQIPLTDDEQEQMKKHRQPEEIIEKMKEKAKKEFGNPAPSQSEPDEDNETKEPDNSKITAEDIPF